MFRPDCLQLQKSMNVLWIGYCSAYSEPMTSHALGWLAGSRWTSWPPSWKFHIIIIYIGIHQSNDPAKFHSDPIWALGFFWKGRPKTTKNSNKMSSNTESVPDPKEDSVQCIGGWKSYRRVSRALRIHFFRHFCCRMYRSATMHSVTDRQTDRRYHANSRPYCVQYDRLK